MTIRVETMEEFKQSVISAIKSIVTLEEVNQFNNLSNKEWTAYCELIKSYRKGTSVDVGWYALICDTLQDAGLDRRTSYILAYVRDEIEWTEE